jgi:hypothetical protein
MWNSRSNVLKFSVKDQEDGKAFLVGCRADVLPRDLLEVVDFLGDETVTPKLTARCILLTLQICQSRSLNICVHIFAASTPYSRLLGQNLKFVFTSLYHVSTIELIRIY